MGDGEASGSRRLVPVDLDYYSLRRELWLATDFAYKKAVETYSKKLGIMKNRLMKDTLPDFAKAMPTVSLDTNFSFPKFNFEEYCEIVKDISKIYRDYSEIHNSSVSFEYFQDVIYYINSEGTEFVKTKQFTGFETAGASQCEDGMPIYNFYSAYADEPAKLPQKDSLRKATEILCKNLSKMYEVKSLEDSYSGPILFVGQASAELFAQVFAPNLVAQRKSLSEQGLQSFSRYTAFQTKIGGRVLPEFISVYSSPLKKDFNNIPLLGFFKKGGFGKSDSTGFNSPSSKSNDGMIIEAPR